jgi:hypothetical protein
MVQSNLKNYSSINEVAFMVRERKEILERARYRSTVLGDPNEGQINYGTI